MPLVIVALIAFAVWLLPLITTGLFYWLAFVFKDSIMGVIVDLLGLGVNAINRLGLDLPTFDQILANLPPIVPLVFARLGLDHCISMIVAAYSAKWALGMLPFVGSFRTGE